MGSTGGLGSGGATGVGGQNRANAVATTAATPIIAMIRRLRAIRPTPAGRYADLALDGDDRDPPLASGFPGVVRPRRRVMAATPDMATCGSQLLFVDDDNEEMTNE